jgi:diguanylate cyclase (GGDEF)-like protein
MTDLQQDHSAFARAVAPQVDQALASKRYVSRFPQPLERSYQAYAADLKSGQSLKATAISLVVFNLGIIMDYTAHPDHLWEFLLIRVVFASLPCLYLVWFSRRLATYALRDWLSGAALIWIGLSMNILVEMRGSPPVQLAFGIGLLIVVANVVFHLRTAVAASTSLVIMLVTTAFLGIRVESSLTPADGLALLFVAAAGVLTLLANYRLECTLRHLYLMILRETLRTGDMERVNEELTAISQTDPLTGIANRRLFDRQFGTACGSSLDTGEMLALLLIDVDHFKRYNDTHGHLVGDACLKQVAKTIALQVRRERDLPARIGGEEFAVLLRDATETAAQKVADRIHRALAADWPEGLAPITVSIGLAILRSPSADAIMAAADKALYEAKNGGRNRTITTATAA